MGSTDQWTTCDGQVKYQQRSQKQTNEGLKESRTRANEILKWKCKGPRTGYRQRPLCDGNITVVLFETA